MSRFIRVVPFPMLLIAAVACAGLLVVQWLIHEAASAIMSTDAQSVTCEPQEIKEIRGNIYLTALCQDKEVATTNAKAIVSWVNEGTPVVCTRQEYWNSDEAEWRCVTKAEK